MAWTVGIVVTMLLAPTTARADASPTSKVLIEVEGPDAAATRRELLAGLVSPKQTTVTVVDGGAFRAALSAQGRSVGSLLAGSRTAVEVPIQTAASDADAVVLAQTERTKSGRKVRIVFVALHPSAVVLDDVVALPTHAKSNPETVASTLAPGIDALRSSSARRSPRAEAPPAPLPFPVAGAAAGPAEDKPTPSPTDLPLRLRGIGHATFDVGAGFELGMRRFDYKDRITTSLRSYELDGVPLVNVAGEVYPLEPLGRTVLRDLGLAARYRHAVGLDSETSNGVAASTSWSELAVGVRARLRTGDLRDPIVYVGVDYEATTFELTTADPKLTTELPSVAYRAIRVGADGRIPVGPVAILAGLGYHGVLEAGPVRDRFPHSSEAGIDAKAGVAVPLVFLQGLEARALATYTRYFYDFSPQPGDRYVAGGALDQFAAINVGLAYAR